MKIMNEYTFHHLKKNKQHTIAIMVSITIASALLCSLCILGQTLWKSRVNAVIEKQGYWHGELWNSITGDKLQYITENPEIETVMIKGSWITAKLSNTKRPYLLMRDANMEFWNDMNLKNTLKNGRLPEKTGEIVVSKVFFRDNPSFKIGDKLILPVGNRMLDGNKIDTQATKNNSETFKSIGEETYTIVGELDITGVSAHPGYIAMGYLDISDVKENDELTVYMRMNNPRKIYTTLPKIAKSVGLEKNEYGKYGVRYNESLLQLYGINDSNNENILALMVLATVLIFSILVMGAFVLIIYNAFSLSANSRMKQLSILKSLGATPKQIKYSILYEGFVLCITQVPTGIILGYLFSNIIVSKINEILSITEDYSNINITFSWIVVIFAFIMSLFTVLTSAYFPARKVAKLSAIDGIRQNNNIVKIKKQKSYLSIKKIFSINEEIALSQFIANKKAFRTAVISLSMCFILIVGYINIVSITNLGISKSETESKNDNISSNYNMKVNLDIIDDPSDEMIDEIISLDELKDSVVRRVVKTSTYVKTENESDIFTENGGFNSVNKTKYNVSSKNDSYKIIVNLIGLSDKSFKEYCNKININFNEYYEDEVLKGVFLDRTYHRQNGSKDIKLIPMLNMKKNDSLNLWEKTEDDMVSKYNFNVDIGAVTDFSPTNLISMNKYSTALIVPMTKYQNITEKFMSERELEYNSIAIDLLVNDVDSDEVKNKLTQIITYYIGSEDFRIWSLLEEENHDLLVQKSVKISIISIALMIGLIGIFNAFSTISNNLKLRRREFAILRSIGITPKGINKILLLEGIFFGLLPIIISIPVILLISWYMLDLTLVTWLEFINNFPVWEVLTYTFCIIGTILFSYGFSARTIKNDNVISTIRDETL